MKTPVGRTGGIGGTTVRKDLSEWGKLKRGTVGNHGGTVICVGKGNGWGARCAIVSEFKRPEKGRLGGWGCA